MTHLWGTWLVNSTDVFTRVFCGFIWDMTHSSGTWLVYERPDSYKCNVSRSYGMWRVHVGHDWFMRDWTRWHNRYACTHAPLIHMGHGLFMQNVTRSFGTWLVHMGRDSYMKEMTRRHNRCIHARVPLIYVGHDSFMWDVTQAFGTWIANMGVWHIHMERDSFIWDMTRSCGTWSIFMNVWRSSTAPQIRIVIYITLCIYIYKYI